MKTLLLLAAIAATSQVDASTLPTGNLQATDLPAMVTTNAAAVQAPQRLPYHRAALGAPAKLSGIKGTVVKEMRATKAFVQKTVVKDETADIRLIVLAGLGLIVLQLRRKHKSLPQRRIAPYA
jgi:hypothetical protein